MKVFVYDKKTNQTVFMIWAKAIAREADWLFITDDNGDVIKVDCRRCKTRIYQN